MRYLIERQASRDALRLSEARFRAMSDASPLGIFVSDAQGGCVYTNAAYHKISGLSFEQTLGTNWSMAIHPDDRERVLTEWRLAARGQAAILTEFRFLQNDDSVVWTRVNSAAMRDDQDDGKASFGQVQTVEDISERKVTESVLRAAEEALFEEKERAQVTLNSIGDAVLTTDLAGNVSYLNLVAEAMTGWLRESALGRPLAEVFRIIDSKTRAVAENPAQRAIKEDKTVGITANCMLIRRDGFESAIEDSAAPIHNRAGRVIGAVLVFHDVSESRAVALRMAHLAQHDFLTGLPNRVQLNRTLLAGDRPGQPAQEAGWPAVSGPGFLQTHQRFARPCHRRPVAAVRRRAPGRLRTATDTVCRQGGDEFVILLAEIEQPLDATFVAEKLLAAFALPHLIEGHELHVSLSIGISIYPDDGNNVDSVMQNADTAMFHAKANGRNKYPFFRAEMNTSAVRRLVIESSLRRALRQNEFLLYYQPKIDLASGAMIGAEALIRWQDTEHGLVFPGQFVPVAEESGLIVPIGRWVLREACRQVQAWLDAGLPAVTVAVNISAIEFRHKDFLAGVALILKESGLNPRYLELELTESILMEDVEASAIVPQALKAMGVQLAIDDFGTGYSSLSYLKRFPITTLKIDQSFVRDIVTDPDDETLVSAIIGMGKSLHQRVIAEGVETPEQLEFLRASQCDEGQGFLFHKPLSAEDFERLLASS